MELSNYQYKILKYIYDNEYIQFTCMELPQKAEDSIKCQKTIMDLKEKGYIRYYLYSEESLDERAERSDFSEYWHLVPSYEGAAYVESHESELKKSSADNRSALFEAISKVISAIISFLKTIL